jgi:hypothetical protein
MASPSGRADYEPAGPKMGERRVPSDGFPPSHGRQDVPWIRHLGHCLIPENY